jgi:CMP-N-acetylneuraminic acid synthetase
MYNNLRILALIPARGGSKGIKNKNIIDLNGHPLIYYTIQAGLKSSYIDDVVVSTDSETIAHVAKECGASVPFLRPQELASDHAKTIDSVLHAINTLRIQGKEYDLFVLLQPTSPLRDSNDIDAAIEQMMQSHSESLVSISPVSDSPILIRTIDDNYKLSNLLAVNSTVRRQDMKPYYVVNGSIYINYVKDLSLSTSLNDNASGYIMSARHSADIDEMSDLIYARILMQETL